MKEAKARIKINQLLEDVGWKFFNSNDNTSNIIVENNVKLTEQYIDVTCENFEKSKTELIPEQKIKEKIARVWGE